VKTELKGAMIHVLLPLGFGAAIYLLWRADNLAVFHWAQAAQIDDQLRDVRSAFVVPVQPTGWVVELLIDQRDGRPMAFIAQLNWIFLDDNWISARRGERTGTVVRPDTWHLRNARYGLLRARFFSPTGT